MKNAMTATVVMRRAFAASLVSALLVSLAACGGAKPDESKTLVTVGEAKITEHMRDAFAELMMIEQGYLFSDITDEPDREQIKTEILDIMIQAEAIKQYYGDENVLPDDVAEQAKAYENTLGQTLDLKELGITGDLVRYYVEAQYFRQALTREVTEDGALPTESDVEAYYLSHTDEFEERRSRHILIGDGELRDEDRAEAERILAEIQNAPPESADERAPEDGADIGTTGAASDVPVDLEDGGEAVPNDMFARMAAQYGQDSTKDTGGDLGFAKKGAYVPEFETVLFSNEVGTLCILESRFGFHILEITDARVPPLDEVRDTVSETLTYQLYAERVGEIMNDMNVEYAE